MKLHDQPKVLRIVISGILCAALFFALMQTGNAAGTGGESNSLYYGLTLLCLAAFELLYFAYKRQTDPRRLDCLRLLYTALCFAAAVCAFAIPDSHISFIVPSILYLLTPIIKRIVAITTKRKARNKVYNVLVLIVSILALLGTIGLVGAMEDKYSLTSLFACMIIVLSCLVNICTMVFSQFNKEILLRIINKTYAGEILLGLLLLIVAFSMVLTHNEPGINSFGDALWYCFAVITTIGFGDIAAVSLLGRILTVILGLYGIVVVSILTSIIVNFYTEIKDRATLEPTTPTEGGEDGTDASADADAPAAEDLPAVADATEDEEAAPSEGAPSAAADLDTTPVETAQ